MSSRSAEADSTVAAQPRWPGRRSGRPRRPKDNPADLINVALEELVRARWSCPFTAPWMSWPRASAPRSYAVFAGIAARMTPAEVAVADGLLEVDPVRRRSDFDRLEDGGAWRRRCSGSRTTSSTWPGWTPSAPRTRGWPGCPRQGGPLRRGGPGHRRGRPTPLCAGEEAGAGGRADPYRGGALRPRREGHHVLQADGGHKRARERLEQLREETRAESERLLDTFGEVLAGVREAPGVSPGEQDSGVADAAEEVCARAGRLVLGALGQASGVAALSAASTRLVTAHHGNNYLPLVERFCRSSRPALFGLLDVLVLRPRSADTSLLDAIRFLRASHGRTGEYIPAHEGGKEIDLSFAPEAWRKIMTDRRRPGLLVRLDFEGRACFLPGGRAAFG